MWVEFITVFRWRPTPSLSIRYGPGMEVLVTRSCGEAAIKAGAARKIPRSKGATGGEAGKDFESDAIAKEAGPTA